MMDTEIVYSSSTQMEMSGLEAGTYSIEFIPEDNKERRVWTSRVVRVE